MNASDAGEYVVYNGRLQRIRSTRQSNKPFQDMSTLRKLTSFKYLGHKMRSWLHKDSRDTIASADDDDELCLASLHEIICCEELMSEPAKSTHDFNDRRSSVTTTRTSDSETSRFSHSFIHDDVLSCIYEPTKDQRWCQNCNKCFQRQLSHFDLYCGLDCKTAHRVRLSS